MDIWVVVFELLGGATAATALIFGITWAKQDHKDTTTRDAKIRSTRAEIQRLESLITPLDAWFRLPDNDATDVRTAKTTERNSYREALAAEQGKLEAMEAPVDGVVVAASQTAYRRARQAAIFGMAAIIFGATAGVLGVVDDQTDQAGSPAPQVTSR